MIATSHVIIGGAVGVAVGTVTQNPPAALAAGIISHFICDAIPHLDAPFKVELKNDKYDEPIWTKQLVLWAIADSLLAFFLTLFLWNKYFHLTFFAPFAWGALGGYLPDLLDNFPIWRDAVRKPPVLKQIHALHLGMHNLWRFKYEMPASWLIGTITQLVFIIPSLWFITK